MVFRFSQPGGEGTRWNSKSVRVFPCPLLEPSVGRHLVQSTVLHGLRYRAAPAAAIAPLCRRAVSPSLAKSCWRVAQSCCPALRTHPLPTRLLAALVPSAVTATGRPNRCLPHRRDEEIYDDVEPIGLLRRGQGFLLPPVSQPPAHPRPGGGGYRRGWDAAWGERGSSGSPRPPEPWAVEPVLSTLLP